MEEQMARACTSGRSIEHAPRRILDDLVEPEIYDAIPLPVRSRNRLMAVRLVLTRQIRTASGMLVLDELSELTILNFYRTSKSAEIVGEYDSLAVLHLRHVAYAVAKRDKINQLQHGRAACPHAAVRRAMDSAPYQLE